MRKHGMLIALGLLVLVNIIVLAGIVYNRSGEPIATITLTERELPLVSYSRYDDRENTGLSLRLDWSTAWDDEWFNKAQLEAIGFDCSLSVNDPKAELHYRKMLPRKTFVVLEYEGSTWKAWLSAWQQQMDYMETKAQEGAISNKELERELFYYNRTIKTRSRLSVIDAASDAHALRKQYNRLGCYLILPATVRMDYSMQYDSKSPKKESPRLSGRIENILNGTIYVPKEHRPILEKLMRGSRQKKLDDYELYGERKRRPTYEVKLNIGKRSEPWIVAVRELAAEVPK